MKRKTRRALLGLFLPCLHPLSAFQSPVLQTFQPVRMNPRPVNPNT